MSEPLRVKLTIDGNQSKIIINGVDLSDHVTDLALDYHPNNDEIPTMTITLVNFTVGGSPQDILTPVIQ